jgi:hypothetical protein
MSMFAKITTILIVTLLAGINAPGALAQADNQPAEEEPEQDAVPDEPAEPPPQPTAPEPAIPQPAVQQPATPQPATSQPVAGPARLTLTHSGAYIAKVRLTYTLNGATIKALDEDNLRAGWHKDIEIPATATTIHLEVYAATGLVWTPWGEILIKTWPTPTTVCVIWTGTSLNRDYRLQCP